MGNGILVICDVEGGAFKKTTFELLGKATELAGSAPVTAVVVGDGDGASLGAYGATTVFQATGEQFGRYNTGPYVRAVQAGVAAADPATILASATPANKEALPRLAARIGAGIGAECTELRADGGAIVGRRPMYAGKAFADVRVSSSVAIYTVRPTRSRLLTRGREPQR